MVIEVTAPVLFGVTESAMKRIVQLIKIENRELILRVYITGGGCSGFQYGFKFVDYEEADDIIIENEYDKTHFVKVVIDPLSFQYLEGGTLDYQEGLQGAYFTVINPNASTTCGCGSSFSI